ncbi:hypothetical protein C5E43_12325 [Nocardia cyriacigeorgica]|nr:hypothetical protein [Nocardia cyriacigeorgica]PPJ11669.1 hypothetical protein C5E43_12325 [Nocardia cyriacigeorgica]
MAWVSAGWGEGGVVEVGVSEPVEVGEFVCVPGSLRRGVVGRAGPLADGVGRVDVVPPACGFGPGCVVGVGLCGDAGGVDGGVGVPVADGEFDCAPPSSVGAVAVAAAAVVLAGAAVVRGAPVVDCASGSVGEFGSGRSSGLGVRSAGASWGGRLSLIHI